MNISDNIIGTVIEKLKADANFAQTNVFREFPGTLQDLPIRETQISVGIDSVVLTGEAEQAVNGSQLFGRARLKITVYAPKNTSGTGARCISTFENISKCIARMSATHTVEAIECSDVKYSMAIGGLFMNVFVTFSGKLLT